MQPEPADPAARYLSSAEREASHIPDVPVDTDTIAIGSIGIVGAGTMGSGIAMAFLNAGLTVTLVESNQEALVRGIGVIRRNYDNSVKKGRLTPEQAEHSMGLITSALSLDALSSADLIIEAIYENMAVKQALFVELDKVAKKDAILASNTSLLDLDEIASVVARPERVVGLHFFSPANIMRLVEIVRGAQTSKEVLATALELAKHIEKVAVVSRVCHGFIANRLMRPRLLQAEDLVLEGPSPADIDRVIQDFGFAMGPFRMIDLVGLDVVGRNDTTRSLRGDLVAHGRFGQKKNGGFYDYDENRNPSPSLAAAEIIAEFARYKSVPAKASQSDAAILARLLYPIVNEGAKILEEGIALRASDIDVAAVLGYNWPARTGGPMYWADTIGLNTIVAGLKDLQSQHGTAFKPAALLEKRAAEGKSFTRH